MLPVFAMNHKNNFCEHDFRGYTSFLNDNTIDIIDTQNELCWNVVQVAKKMTNSMYCVKQFHQTTLTKW